MKRLIIATLFLITSVFCFADEHDIEKYKHMIDVFWNKGTHIVEYRYDYDRVYGYYTLNKSYIV